MTTDPTLVPRLREFIGALDGDDPNLWTSDDEVKLSLLVPQFGALTRDQVRASGAIRKRTKADPNAAPVVLEKGSVEEAKAAVAAAETALTAAQAKTVATKKLVRVADGKLADALRNWAAVFPIQTADVVHREHIKRLAAHAAAGNVAQPTRVNGSGIDTMAAGTKSGSGGRAQRFDAFRRGAGTGRRLPSDR